MSFVDYRLLDQKIGEVASSVQLNVLFYINPQNLLEEKNKFFEELKKGNEYNPKFIYPSKNPLYSYFSMQPTFETYKKDLTLMLEELNSECLGLLCENKILDILESIELVKSIGTENFSENSSQFYGSVDKNLLKLAKEQLSKRVRKEKVHKLTQNEAKNIILGYFKKKKLNYKIVMRESAGSAFSLEAKNHILYITKDTKFDSGLVKRLIAHEIETHAYRYENGLAQPYSLLAKGTSKRMLETEEGLAVNVEQLKGLQVDSQLKNYAGRVLAISLASKKSFFETYSALTQHFSKEDAFILTRRAKRGTFRNDSPGAFTKDMLYFKGMFTVREFLETHDLEKLYYGKYSVEDVPLVFGVDGLKKPKYLPEIPTGLK
jgi:uncharacterized protein (TIGR02421 family)